MALLGATQGRDLEWLSPRGPHSQRWWETPEWVGRRRRKVKGGGRGGLTCQKGCRRGPGTGLEAGPSGEPGQQGVFTFCGLPLPPGIGGPQGTRCFSPELISGLHPRGLCRFPRRHAHLENPPTPRAAIRFAILLLRPAPQGPVPPRKSSPQSCLG